MPPAAASVTRSGAAALPAIAPLTPSISPPHTLTSSPALDETVQAPRRRDARRMSAIHRRFEMLRSVGMLAATGLVGLVAIKLLGVLLLPLLGMFLGFVMWALKIVLIVALIWFGLQLFQRWSRERGSEA